MRIAFLQCGFVRAGFNPAAFDTTNIGQFFPFGTQPLSSFNSSISHTETMTLQDAVKMVMRVKSWTLSGTLTKADSTVVTLGGNYPTQYQDDLNPLTWTDIPNEQFFCNIGTAAHRFPVLRLCYSANLSFQLGNADLVQPIAFMDNVTPGYFFYSLGLAAAGVQPLNTDPTLGNAAGQITFAYGSTPKQLFYVLHPGDGFLDATLTPHEWWEYRDAAFENPIYDSSTGAQLIFPLPTGL